MRFSSDVAMRARISSAVLDDRSGYFPRGKGIVAIEC